MTPPTGTRALEDSPEPTVRTRMAKIEQDLATGKRRADPIWWWIGVVATLMVLTATAVAGYMKIPSKGDLAQMGESNQKALELHRREGHPVQDRMIYETHGYVRGIAQRLGVEPPPPLSVETNPKKETQ